MSRINQTLLNAKVNILSYVILFGMALFSRKIFIEMLGDDLMGLNITMQNILGILNLAELGIWPATAFALYKYIHNNDKDRIIEIVSLFGYLYKIVGFIILACSLVTLFFLNRIFDSTHLSDNLIVMSFLSFLYGSVISYFFNYKQILLIADQKIYVTVLISSAIQIAKVSVQIALLKLVSDSYYLWLTMEVIFATMNTLLLNKYVNEIYPWLQTLRFDKALLKEHKDIITNIKRLVSHKFAAVAISQTDNILIFTFTNLAQVTAFSNYALLIGRASSFLISVFNSGASSIGNLIVTGDKAGIMKVFWELMSIRYLITGIMVIGTYYIIDPFIILWIGQKYLLETNIQILLLFNIYVSVTRMSIDNYIEAYGLFGHVWAPWTEALINLGLSILMGYHYGIIGVLGGTAVSLVIIVCIWRPYYLFRQGFKTESILNYWANVLKYIFTLGIVWLIVDLVLKSDIAIKPTNYGQLFLHMLEVLASTSILYGLVFYVSSSGFRDFSQRIFRLIKPSREINQALK